MKQLPEIGATEAGNEMGPPGEQKTTYPPGALHPLSCPDAHTCLERLQPAEATEVKSFSSSENFLQHRLDFSAKG